MARPGAFSSLFRDIHAPRDLLPELAAERHHNRELVLLTTNWAQLDLALNLVAQLEALGLHHHVLFGDNARLVEHVRRHGPPGASMVWSSLLERYTQPLGPDPRCPSSCGDEGLAGTFAMNRASLPPPPNRSAAATACHAAQREHCLPSAASFYRCDSVRRLWLLRHHYTARLLNMRYNVLLLDSDSMVLADPYPLVRRHLQGYTALCLHDITARPMMTANGGTWYVRGASPEGPVQRVFASAFERALQACSCVCVHRIGPLVWALDHWRNSIGVLVRIAMGVGPLALLLVHWVHWQGYYVRCRCSRPIRRARQQRSACLTR